MIISKALFVISNTKVNKDLVSEFIIRSLLSIIYNNIL